jgi:hypothetical protein
LLFVFRFCGFPSYWPVDGLLQNGADVTGSISL